jgi:hypothetical protein
MKLDRLSVFPLKSEISGTLITFFFLKKYISHLLDAYVLDPGKSMASVLPVQNGAQEK